MSVSVASSPALRPAPVEKGSAPKLVPALARWSTAMTDSAEPTRVALMSGDEKAAALCDDIAASVHPDTEAVAQHCGQIERSAEDMLARLDELVAVLNKLREDSKEQREALTPALEAWTAGLARDFAYLDSAEETVEAVKRRGRGRGAPARAAGVHRVQARETGGHRKGEEGDRGALPGVGRRPGVRRGRILDLDRGGGDAKDPKR